MLCRMLWSCLLVVPAAQGADRRVAFVGCPILRNTTLPCWLGETGGELYYLGPQGDLTADFYPPEFRHKMLVQGVVSDQPRICGGLVLKPVKVSVLPALDINCNVMLPAAAYPDPPNKRGSGPSGVKGGALPPAPPRPVPAIFAAPYTTRTFTAVFDADSERLWRPAQVAVETAARYATEARASTIDILAYRASFRLSDGTDYVEAKSIGQSRARAIEQALITVGVPRESRIVVRWKTAAMPSNQLQENNRAQSVSITVKPG